MVLRSGRDFSIPVDMMTSYQPRQVVNNVLSYSPYALPGSGFRELPRAAPPVHASYPAMRMHMYAEPEYAYSAAHQHQQQQQQVIASPGYYSQSFRRMERPLVHQPRGTTQHRFRPNNNMAYTPHIGDDELADLQELSAKYEPEVKGPLVGQRQSSSAITEEYAAADPIYQQKTASLAKTFSHYRTVRGDGRCGWRAIGFSFFEKLVGAGDATKIAEQEARLHSLHNIINAAGYQPMLWEDFADDMYDALRKVAQALKSGSADTVLLEIFNDEPMQNSIITHLRTLTAAWMKTHPEDYINYTPDLSVDRYCDDTILPFSSEIEHVGLSALNDVLLAPAGISLEVLYLDLSPGSDVNGHNFTRSEQFSFTAAHIRLLYRPGHYDILYKPEDIPPPPISTYLQISSQPYNDPVFDLPVADFMTMVPGMSMTNRQHGWVSSTNYGGMCDFFPALTPAQPCAQPISLPTAAPVAASTSTLAQTALVSPPSTALSAGQDRLLEQDLAFRPALHSVPQREYSRLGGSGGPFRLSPYNFAIDHDVAHAQAQATCQTVQFKNSHFNTAHFRNENFQPEEFDVTTVYGNTSSKAARHKTSG